MEPNYQGVIAELRSKRRSKWSTTSNKPTVWVMGKKTRVKLDRELKPTKQYLHGAIERSRESRVFREFIRRVDDITDTETFPKIEEVLNPIDPERAILYRKCSRPDFKFCIFKAGLAVDKNYEVRMEEMVRIKRIAGLKREALFRDLVKDKCLPKWFTYDKSVFIHEGILWCQPGKPENGQRLRDINNKNPFKQLHWIHLKGSKITHNPFKAAIDEGVTPYGFDHSTVPFASPRNFCEKYGYDYDVKDIKSPFEPIPEIIDLTDSASEYDGPPTTSDDEDDVQLIMDYESQDSSQDSGLYDITQDSATSEGEEVDLFDYIDDPWEEAHFKDDLNYGLKSEIENNNEPEKDPLEVLAIDSRLWQPEVFGIAKFLGPNYAFKPEMFKGPPKFKMASAVLMPINLVPKLSPKIFMEKDTEEERLGKQPAFKNVIKHTFQRADALERAMIEEENYANE